MSDYRLNRPPELRGGVSKPLITGSAIMMAVMVALPLSQMVAGTPKKPSGVIDTTPYAPPPYVAPEIVDDDKKDEPEIDELKEDVPPPTIAEIEFMNNPDLSGFGSPDYTVNYNGWDEALKDVLHTIDELTRVPRPIRQPQPMYPQDLKTAGIEGEVVLSFVVEADGTTSRIKTVSSSNPGFERPAIKSVRRWIFQPGEKDGEAVNTIVRIQIPFRIDRGL